MKDNYFLESFVNVLNSEDPNNQSGLNLANANTFLSLNQLQQVDLQTAFAQIYGTAETKDDALSIINYIMVKDGLQMSYNTLLSAISPFTMEAYLVQIETANQSLRGYNPLDKTSDEKMMATFGLTFQELQNEFIDGYALSNINNSLLKTYTVSEISKLPESIVLNRENKTLTAPTETPRFFRIGYDNFDGNTVYVTYKRESNQVGEDVPFSEDTRELYVQVDTMGSNQQNAIGFMFGERPTYKEVRQYVKNKNIMSDESDTTNLDSTPTTTTQKEQVLSDQNANVEAKNGEVLIDGINIADINQEDIEVVGTEENAVSAAGLLGLLGAQSAQQTSGVAVKEVANGVKIIDNALTSSEEAEIFQMIKPFLESQGSRSNKGNAAPIMIGMGLRWDYKSNNPGKSPVEIKETIVNSQGQRNKYAYYDVSIDGEALGAIPTRLKELMTKATGIDASNYDGAIINIYPKNGFISAHNDVDESVTAINYPVIVANIGGAGSLSIEGAESQKARKGYSSKEYINEPLSSGSAYIFGEDGKNRDVFHRTLPSSGEGNLPQLNVKGQIIPANSYRISVTLRRVKDLEPGMPTTPNKITQPAQQTSEVKEIKEEDLSFKKGKLETFTLMSQQEVKGTAIVIEGQPNVDLFVWEVTKGYQYEGGWRVIDNNSKKGWPLSSFFGGTANTKSEVLEALHSDIVKYSKEAKKKIELESIGFNFGKPVPQTSEVESELSEAEESVTPLEGQLLLDLTLALDNQYTTLTNFWDDKIQGDPEFKAKLRAQKILSLEDMVDAYKDGIYTSEEEFIESLGCL